MPTTVQDVMTTDLVTCPTTATLRDVAQLMRDHDIGDVLITNESRLEGIVTDRDLVVRCLADGADSNEMATKACSPILTTVSADASIDQAAELMRANALRRLPVVDADRPIGIVSLGDLAIERDPESVLGSISDAAPTS